LPPTRSNNSPQSLPIDALHDALLATLEQGPVVVSAPTGSGKSTQIPRWCPGPVLVVEPRRVACRSLAARVAQLEGSRLGDHVGYHVRDDRRTGPNTRITFATPGIVLKMLSGSGDSDAPLPFRTVILDELHERGLETDLILALLRKRTSDALSLIAMSATLDGDQVATYLGGAHLEGKGRLYPVSTEHVGDPAALPSGQSLAQRVASAMGAARSHPGDILVFLPGKAEIAAVEQTLRDGPEEVLTLHGGLTLDQQARAFSPGARRRIILATNVAETSLTLPRIGVVVDTGLVRRTQYDRGRGALTLLPIAQDSADQRAGRAGRLGPGVCLRLWGRAARLTERTPPEILRESLVPLVLGAAACGHSVRALPMLDAPPEHALAEAERYLRGLDALSEDAERLTAVGATLFQWPLDPGLGRIIIEARRRKTLGDAQDLVAALSVDRPLFQRERPQYPEDDLRLQAGGCDAVALITALRDGDPRVNALSGVVLSESRRMRDRLIRRLDAKGAGKAHGAVDRRALAATLLAADPASAYIARRRRGRVTWANGGPEVSLARESAIDVEKTEAIIALSERTLGSNDARAGQRLVTYAMPVPLRWLADAGLGEPRIGPLDFDKRRRSLKATVERVLAGKVLSTEERPLRGADARAAIARLIIEGRVFRSVPALIQRRTDQRKLWRIVQRRIPFRDQAHLQMTADALATPPEDLATYLTDKLTELGLESAKDLSLLGPDDLAPDPLPEAVQTVLDKDFPPSLDFGDASYAIEYALGRQQVTVRQVGGSRKHPPELSWLPAFRGLKVLFQKKGTARVLKER
jgi:ATP-dependent helicase HrpB